MTTDTRPDEVDQRTPQARGHLIRTGHKLTGYYVPTDIHPGIVELVRTCACGAPPITYRIRFTVGADRRTVDTAVTLTGAETIDDDAPRKIAAAGLTSPHQFPASAVRILSAVPLDS